MDKIDRTNPTPLYEQIKVILRQEMLNGKYGPGSQLPTESELCTKFGVSRITIIRALDELERVGMIRRIRGKGSIVPTQPILSSLSNIAGFSGSVIRQGLRPGAKLLSAESIEGDFDLLTAFGLPTNTPHRFFKFRRLRLINDIPAVIMTTYVEEGLGKTMKERGVENVSFYNLYEEIMGRRVVRNEATLTPILATAEAIKLLKVAPGTPHFLFRGMSYLEGGLPVELAIAIHHGDMFQFTSTIYMVREEVINREKQPVSSLI
jgi:GntR family transcriptional regulator